MSSEALKHLDFLLAVGESKQIPRTGWVELNINNPESVAEHSFRLTVMAMSLTPLLGDVDREKMIKMAIIHDIGEVETGDIVVARGGRTDIKKREIKEQDERSGLKKIFSIIGDEEDTVAIFDEMIARNTAESILFWEIDKLEMAIQALEYEKTQKKNLQEFFDSAEIHLTHSVLISIFQEVLKRRPREGSPK